MVAVIVVAGGVGVGVTMALTGAPAQPAAAASSPPNSSGDGGSSPSRGGAPGAGGGNAGNEESQISMLGTVTAVSATSITIGGNGLSVTATVTSTTRVTGGVSSIGEIKVGDVVSAHMTQSGTNVTATAIQYPAQQNGPNLP